ncbi:unnamed protein product [Vitrella brassicaformis CCMP3155]|uniref:BPL/LPL catalytic domain-containing protein n=1 Tax=Vitrella brassicaformis (strain CCMP3155) TaxID=1169540 RepID=A0A0G4EEZ0_VITBC|nr:unnamed protein product [Vitrella brassicaformis CCMP3155]|eukprot:CEL93985.1 unnamed protein product [Vitrella brassicaformis CCMP3155]
MLMLTLGSSSSILSSVHFAAFYHRASLVTLAYRYSCLISFLPSIIASPSTADSSHHPPFPLHSRSIAMQSLPCIETVPLRHSHTGSGGPSSLKRLHFESLPSTQRWAQERFDRLLEEGLSPSQWVLVSAANQTDGIGTYDIRLRDNRRWYSPGGNVHATFVAAWPSEKRHLLFHVPQVTTLAVAHTLDTFGIPSQVKWVNDVLLDGHKVCGVLCNAPGLTIQDAGETYSSLLVGIGINVNDRGDADSDYATHVRDQRVTSVNRYRASSGQPPVTAEDIVQQLQHRVCGAITQLMAEGFAPFLPMLNARLAYRGQPIAIDMDGDVREGVLEGLNADGSLRLRTATGSVETYVTGRIVKNGTMMANSGGAQKRTVERTS